jgi:hypothetical protein
MVSGLYQSPTRVIEFSKRYYDDLNIVIGNRMRNLGVPEIMIGIQGYPGLDERAFTRFPMTQIGGNINPTVMSGMRCGIALDHGVLDASHPRMSQIPTWSAGSLRDRIDSAIVHEFIEATLVPPSGMIGLAAVDWLHREAVQRAPDYIMPITSRARRILQEYRQALRLGP